MPLAPRYPDRLLWLLEELDDDLITLAEMVRRVGEAAQAEGITRPSPAHVRRLVAELRLLRAEEREVRRATLETIAGTLPYRLPTPLELGTARDRARERARADGARRSR